MQQKKLDKFSLVSHTNFSLASAFRFQAFVRVAKSNLTQNDEKGI